MALQLLLLLLDKRAKPRAKQKEATVSRLSYEVISSTWLGGLVVSALDCGR